MNYEDLEVETTEVENGLLKAVVEFPEESDSGLRVHTDWVTRQVKDQGYDVLSYVYTDTVEDVEDERISGEWKFEIPKTEDDLKVELEENVKRIGPVKAKELSNKYERSELEEAFNKPKSSSIPELGKRAKENLRVYLFPDDKEK